MDLSKLPKLSQTPTNNPPAPTESPPQFIPYASAPNTPSPAAEAWISIAVGAILLLLYPTMLKYISSRLFGTYFAPFLNPPPDGPEIPYPHVYPQFLGDLCITLFAIVMIIDGIAIALIRRKPILIAIFLLTSLATLLNLLLVIFTTTTYGLPIASVLAVAVGGYMAILQLSTLRRLR